MHTSLRRESGVLDVIVDHTNGGAEGTRLLKHDLVHSLPLARKSLLVQGAEYSIIRCEGDVLCGDGLAVPLARERQRARSGSAGQRFLGAQHATEVEAAEGKVLSVTGSLENCLARGS